MNRRPFHQVSKHAAVLILLAGFAAGIASAAQPGDNTRRGLVRPAPSAPPAAPQPTPTPPPQPAAPQQHVPEAPQAQPATESHHAPEAAAPRQATSSAPPTTQRPGTSDRTVRGITKDLRGIEKPKELPTKGVQLLGGASNTRPTGHSTSNSGQSMGRSLFPRPASPAPAASAVSPQFDHTKRNLVKPIESQPDNNGGSQNNSNNFHHHGNGGNSPFYSHGRNHPRYINAYSLPPLFGEIPSLTGNWADSSLFGYQSSWQYPPIFAWQYDNQAYSWESTDAAYWGGRDLYAFDGFAGDSLPRYYTNNPVVVLDAAPEFAAAPSPAASTSPSERRRADLRLRSQINTKYDVMPDFTASINAAVQGEFSTSIYAMRKAAGVNPVAIVGPQSPALQAIAADPNAAQRARFALQTFQNPPQRVVSEADAQFMVAALSAALGDRESAAIAARSALAAGDASTSAILLDRAIRGESLDCSGPWTPGTPLQR